MLEIRPFCELCAKALPANSTEAFICTYECTWCADCVENVLMNVCPNCGGGVEKRPVRPVTERRKGFSINHHPASSKIVRTSFTNEEINDFASKVKDIKPENR